MRGRTPEDLASRRAGDGLDDLELEKSLQVTNELLATHGVAGAIQLEEGSGISHGNRFTARGLANVLNLFALHIALLVSGKGGAAYNGQVRFVISLKSNNGALRFQLLKAIESAL